MRKAGLTMGCVLALAVASSGCSETPYRDTASMPPAATQPVGTSGTDTPVRVADVTANPGGFAGRTVTVVADVEEVLGPRAFKLDEDAVLGQVDDDLLVISSKGGSLSDIDDQWLNNKVRVTGKVGKWTAVEVEKELGWDLDRKLEVEVERVGAVLIATSVQRTDK